MHPPLQILLRHRFTVLVSTAACFAISGCTHPDERAFKRDDYFGGQGNFRPPTNFVPEDAKPMVPVPRDDSPAQD